jgi:tRNA A-37 threonylcarbamoyl transferase component Bud32
MNLEHVIYQNKSKIIYRDGDALIKLFLDGDLYTKANVLNEALNLARVEETGLSIPRLREVTKIDGKWAIIADFIEGESLSDLLMKQPERSGELLSRMVELQKCIHKKRSPLLTKHFDKMARKINEADLDSTLRYELLTRLDSLPKHNKVLHGDFNPGNIILAPNGELFVIDWAHATQGNASADAARTYLIFCLNYSRETAEAYLDLFVGADDVERSHVNRWLPIVAASQSVKNRDGERDFLMRWVNVVEYE